MFLFSFRLLAPSAPDGTWGLPRSSVPPVFPTSIQPRLALSTSTCPSTTTPRSASSSASPPATPHKRSTSSAHASTSGRLRRTLVTAQITAHSRSSSYAKQARRLWAGRRRPTTGSGRPSCSRPSSGTGESRLRSCRIVEPRQSSRRHASTSFPVRWCSRTSTRVYERLGKRGYTHRRINHRARVYVDGDVHTQTIDGFFGLFKSGVRGAHHAVSHKWLQGYLNEWTWRLQPPRGREHDVPRSDRSVCCESRLAALLRLPNDLLERSED